MWVTGSNLAQYASHGSLKTVSDVNHLYQINFGYRPKRVALIIKSYEEPYVMCGLTYDYDLASTKFYPYSYGNPTGPLINLGGYGSYLTFDLTDTGFKFQFSVGYVLDAYWFASAE